MQFRYILELTCRSYTQDHIADKMSFFSSNFNNTFQKILHHDIGPWIYDTKAWSLIEWLNFLPVVSVNLIFVSQINNIISVIRFESVW